MCICMHARAREEPALAAKAYLARVNPSLVAMHRTCTRGVVQFPSHSLIKDSVTMKTAAVFVALVASASAFAPSQP